MENGNIDLVFEELKQLGQCTSRSQFSSEWLGREESYYRSIQSKGRGPSVESQINLCGRLRDLGMSFPAVSIRAWLKSATPISNCMVNVWTRC